jgi:hypothetical protein
VALSFAPTARPATTTPAAGELPSETLLDRLGDADDSADTDVGSLESADIAEPPLAELAPELAAEPEPVEALLVLRATAPMALIAATAAAVSCSDNPVRPDSSAILPLAAVIVPASIRPLLEKRAT